ncbi:hypothetical protein D3C81_2131120 [compost metagenome]
MLLITRLETIIITNLVLLVLYLYIFHIIAHIDKVTIKPNNKPLINIKLLSFIII